VKSLITTAIFSTTALTALPAFADQNEIWQDRYGHMAWGGSYGLFGGLMMLVFWAAIIAIIVFAVRWFSDRDAKQNKPDAMDILKERLAKGEIDPEDYAARRKTLES